MFDVQVEAKDMEPPALSNCSQLTLVLVHAIMARFSMLAGRWIHLVAVTNCLNAKTDMVIHHGLAGMIAWLPPK